MEKLAHISEATVGKLVELQPGKSGLDGPVVHKNVWFGLDKAFNHKCSQPGWGENRKKKLKREAERDGVNEREGRTVERKNLSRRKRKKCECETGESLLTDFLLFAGPRTVHPKDSCIPLGCPSPQSIWNTLGPIEWKILNVESRKLPTSRLSDNR